MTHSMWEGGDFRFIFLSYKEPFTLVFNQNSTGRQRLTTEVQGMPQSERDKRVSGRENEREPPLKEERDASPPLLYKSSSPRPVEHLSSGVRCRAADEERLQFLQLVFQNSQSGPIRPSVLRSPALLLQANESNPTALNRRKDTGHSAQNSIQAVSGSSQHRKQSSSFHSHSPVESEIQRSNSFFVNGQCRWPGCDKVFEGYTHFLRHLNRDHSTDEKTIAQWRVQQDLVRHMENQLIQEKQKLHAMQLHLHLFECISTRTGVATGWWRPLAQNLPRVGEPDGRTERASEAPVRQEPWHIPLPYLLPDFVSSVEYYKYANIRPPYTYAFLIRWLDGNGSISHDASACAFVFLCHHRLLLTLTFQCHYMNSIPMPLMAFAHPYIPVPLYEFHSNAIDGGVTEFVLAWAPRADVPAIKRPYSLVSAGGRQAVFFWKGPGHPFRFEKLQAGLFSPNTDHPSCTAEFPAPHLQSPSP
ncbi:forkhead box protein P1-like [Sinocyclocheilus anshuiensis]|uniref:forkhead box protein P1-like n=1 Tax=Sinocyclocheilus anshuiensis TaxID=1608454 RepID=UPI0007B90BC9|nr:PREDICTED: forkhead box protein P1-like [Sinocyclocheilus anshuiensis]